jgi:hypothetical protein
MPKTSSGKKLILAAQKRGWVFYERGEQLWAKRGDRDIPLFFHRDEIIPPDELPLWLLVFDLDENDV